MLFSTVSFLVKPDVLVLGKEKIKLPGLNKEKAGGRKMQLSACGRGSKCCLLKGWGLMALCLHGSSLPCSSVAAAQAFSALCPAFS